MTAQSNARSTLALVGGFVRPRKGAPHGTVQASYLMCRALAASGAYDQLHVFHDSPRSLGRDGELAVPPGTAVKLFEKPYLPISPHRYRAIYVANGEQLSSAPHLLRPAGDWAPVVCSVGTTHAPGQWSNLLLSLASQAIRPTDGFIFKSRRTEVLFRQVWEDWSGRLREAPAFPEPVGIIPNGVDVNVHQRSEPLRARTRRELRLRPEAVVFLAFSRLSPGTKGDQLALLLHWKQVIDRFPEAVLVLAGAAVDGAFLQELRTSARAIGVAERVLVLDNPFEVMPDAGQALMSAADVFVHLSTGIEETSSLVVHEAMAHGLPVLVADWAGLGDVVVDGEDGYVIETRCGPGSVAVDQTFFAASPLDLAVAASKLVCCDWERLVARVVDLRSPALRARLSHAARRSSEERSIDRIARRYLDFFDQVSGRAERQWPGQPVVRPMVPLDRVLATQASRALGAHERVRLADAQALEWLHAGRQPEDPRRLEVVASLLGDGRALTLGDLATALSDADRASRSPDDPDSEGPFRKLGRFLLRLLNQGVLRLEA